MGSQHQRAMSETIWDFSANTMSSRLTAWSTYKIMENYKLFFFQNPKFQCGLLKITLMGTGEKDLQVERLSRFKIRKIALYFCPTQKSVSGQLWRPPSLIPENARHAGGPNNKSKCQDFPGGSVVKNPPTNAGHVGSIPELGGSRMPLSPRPATIEPVLWEHRSRNGWSPHPRDRAPHQEKPQQRQTCGLQLESSLRSPELEKARAAKRTQHNHE